MIEDKLKQLSEEIPVPDKLKPENIEQLIDENRNYRRTLRARHFANRIALTAACFLLLLSAGNYLFSSGILSFHPDAWKNTSKTAVPSQTETPQMAHSSYDKARETVATYLSSRVEYEAFEDSAENSSSLQDSVGGNMPDKSKKYSDTNLQVEHVDEGDIVKTDGDYIYTISTESFGSMVKIYKADGKATKEVHHFITEDVSVSEMYLYNSNTLVLVGTNWETISKDGNQNKSTILVYNVEDKSKPTLRTSKNQSGYYKNSRMNGKYLYTISTMYAYSADEDDKEDSYIPCVDESLIPEENLYCPDGISSNSYLVLTSLDVTDGKTFHDSLSVLGAEGTCYASEDYIYIASPSYQDYAKTILSKFEYKNGDLNPVRNKAFHGTILDQFSLDEHNGYLRFVATTYKDNGSTSNGLYILDENLKLTGYVSNLAKSERIYSARFLGDTAYFVTYRETDPVFMVDLSDPKNPVVKDKLKLPGFSEYLHPFGDDLLLGIGSNVEDDGYSEVKLSMFDISSDSSIKEKHTKLLEAGTESIAGRNHKAILVDAEKNLIAFCTESYETNKTEYQIYSYNKEKGFKKIAALSPKGLSLQTTRGLYIGNYLYLVDENGMYGMCVYDLDTMKKVAQTN